VCVGTGAQLIIVAFVTMVFALLGFLSPANRGGLMTASLMTFALAGVAAGYVAGRMFRAFQARSLSHHVHTGPRTTPFAC
jgi:transmembrane 9 superfamily member 2/4